MKTVNTFTRNFNKQLLKYYVSQYHSYESSDFEQKEFILMQAHSKVYNLAMYFWTSAAIASVTLTVRFLIIKNY